MSQKPRFYLVDGERFAWQAMIDYACFRGMEANVFVSTSQAARYLRSLGHTVEPETEER